MKRFGAALAVAMLVGVSGTALAALSANFNVTANLSGSFSVAVISGAPVAFGAVAASSNTTAGTAVVIQNDSVGFIEDYQLSAANSTNWTLAAAAAPNTAVLSARFNTVAPAFVANDILTNVAVLAGASAAGNFAGDQDGQDVNPAENNNLWIRLGAPTTDSSGGAVQTFVVTITAVAP